MLLGPWQTFFANCLQCKIKKKKNHTRKKNWIMLLYSVSYSSIVQVLNLRNKTFVPLVEGWVEVYYNYGMRKLFMPYVNNKSADLISAFIVHCLDSIIPIVSISKFSSLYLVPLAAQADLSLTWSETLKTGFLMTRLITAMLPLINFFA